MTQALRARTPSVDDVLDWERSVPERHEYVGGVIRMMVGGTQDHATIAGNVFAVLRARLKSGPCRAFMETIKVRLAEGFAYPDVLVTCGDFEPKSDIVSEPVVLFEVLSPSTQALDRGDKWEAYQALLSLQAYVLISQNAPVVELFRREGAAWSYSKIAGLSAALDLPVLDISLPLAEIFERSSVA